MPEDKFEVYLEHSGPHVQYEAEFSGTSEECHGYITDTLIRQRQIPGMEDTGTFLRVRRAQSA